MANSHSNAFWLYDAVYAGNTWVTLAITESNRVIRFGHQDLFSRVFRRSVGLTPTQFRKQHQHG